MDHSICRPDPAAELGFVGDARGREISLKALTQFHQFQPLLPEIQRLTLMLRKVRKLYQECHNLANHFCEFWFSISTVYIVHLACIVSNVYRQLFVTSFYLMETLNYLQYIKAPVSPSKH